jgi:ACS family tartrate transporter-like MFS transporter
MALVSGETSFYVMRFLLGVAEAGFFPGVILYLTYWFPVRERARIVALFMAAVPLATMVGGPISGALLEMHGFLGLKGWQWLFILEGIPAVLLGLVALRFLDDKPEGARWLLPQERQALSRTLAAEAEDARNVGYAELGQALTRPRVLVLGLLYFCMVIGLYGMSFWMPQVIQTFGLSPLEIGFATAIPYFFATIAMVLWGAHSDRTGERIWHVALPLIIGGAAFARSASPLSLALILVALTLATSGTYAAVSTFWSLPTSILAGTGAAAGLALINSMGNVSGLVGPPLIGMLKQETGSFTAALLFLSAMLVLGAAIALVFGAVERTRLQRSRAPG